MHRDFHRTLDLKSEIIPRCGGRDIKVRRERDEKRGGVEEM